MENYADRMFQGAVGDLQKEEGTYEKYQTFYPHRTQDGLSGDDIAFIQARESFYIASVTADGWPYIQHRGGIAGFIKVLGPTQIACADYPGNKQFISMGNLQNSSKVSLFFMDYLNHARLKMQGTATLLTAKDAPSDILEAVTDSGPKAERVLIIDIIAMDWNCPKYIPTLYPEAVLQQVIGPQMGKLQAENATLKAQLAALNPSE
jgi:predicted pyridoxine 5'-phosphate oxidase superfamily flavin-nucleotide-binding protein